MHGHAGPAARGPLSWPGSHQRCVPRPARRRKFLPGHDVLIVPSTTLEAVALPPLEAQACGLLVLGLKEALSASALRLDMADALSRALRGLRADPAILHELCEAGRRNAARHPLSATAAGLWRLGRDM